MSVIEVMHSSAKSPRLRKKSPAAPSSVVCRFERAFEALPRTSAPSRQVIRIDDRQAQPTQAQPTQAQPTQAQPTQAKLAQVAHACAALAALVALGYAATELLPSLVSGVEAAASFVTSYVESMLAERLHRVGLRF